MEHLPFFLHTYIYVRIQLFCYIYSDPATLASSWTYKSVCVTTCVDTDLFEQERIYSTLVLRKHFGCFHRVTLVCLNDVLECEDVASVCRNSTSEPLSEYVVAFPDPCRVEKDFLWDEWIILSKRRKQHVHERLSEGDV